MHLFDLLGLTRIDKCIYEFLVHSPMQCYYCLTSCINWIIEGVKPPRVEVQKLLWLSWNKAQSGIGFHLDAWEVLEIHFLKKKNLGRKKHIPKFKKQKQ